jgi:hypothetical protein
VWQKTSLIRFSECSALGYMHARVFRSRYCVAYSEHILYQRLHERLCVLLLCLCIKIFQTHDVH